jgi:hypothetical protein
MRTTASFIAALIMLSGCRTANQSVYTSQEKDIGWFSAAHFAHPDAIIEIGWSLIVYVKKDNTVNWCANGRTVDEDGLRAFLSRLRDNRIDGAIVDAYGDVPISAIKKTITILQDYGQRRIVLFKLIEGVESDFFRNLSAPLLELEDIDIDKSNKSITRDKQ